MEANSYVKTSLNDIIFEGRNKAYGAYQLRRLYNYNLFKATFFSATTLVLLLSIYFQVFKLNPHQLNKIPFQKKKPKR